MGVAGPARCNEVVVGVVFPVDQMVKTGGAYCDGIAAPAAGPVVTGVDAAPGILGYPGGH